MKPFPSPQVVVLIWIGTPHTWERSSFSADEWLPESKTGWVTNRVIVWVNIPHILKLCGLVTSWGECLLWFYCAFVSTLLGDLMHSGRYSAHTINGAWSPWSPWSQCSRDCSRGIRNRKRLCNNPEPKYGGLPCVGPSLEYQECNILPCPGKKLGKSVQFGNISPALCPFLEGIIC